MVSLNPMINVEHSNSAYENIFLIANTTWAHDKNDPYRKLNENLWIQNFKYIEKPNDNCVSIEGHNTTSFGSWISQHKPNHNQFYTNCESLYKSYYHQPLSMLHNGDSTSNEQYKKQYDSNTTTTTTEPWMLDDVERYFLQLTSNIPSLEESRRAITSDESSEFNYIKFCPLSCKIINAAELRLQRRIMHEDIRNIWETNERVQSVPLSPSPLSSMSSSSSSSLSSPSSSSSSSSSPSSSPPPALTSSILSCLNSHNGDQLIFNGKQKALRCQNENTISPEEKQNTKLTYDTEEDANSINYPLLRAEVPEFFPKCSQSIPNNKDNKLLHHFPMADKNSENRYFCINNRPPLSSIKAIIHSPNVPLVSVPIITPLMRPSYHHWIPLIPSPMQIQIPIYPLSPQSLSTSLYSINQIIHRPLQLSEKLIIQSNHLANSTPAPIPVYQRPPELYQDQKQRSKKQGVDFNNLILLTKNAIKIRRSQPKNPQPSSSFILESRQPNLKSENDVLRWLNKDYPKKAKEFLSINSLISNLNNCDSKYNREYNENQLMIPKSPNSNLTQHQNYNYNQYDYDNYSMSIKYC